MSEPRANPFPGMDPYLEAFWGDCHSRRNVYACDQIEAQLPADLVAQIEEHLTVEADDRRPGRIYPDLHVSESPGTRAGLATSAGVALAAPVVIEFAVEPEPPVQRSVRIIESRSGGRLVTAVEFLSPANKLEPVGRAAYRRKQDAILAAGASLVEVDLIRRGPFVLAVPPDSVPDDCRSPYRVNVRRAGQNGRAEVYRVPLRERLPVVRVPLRPADADVALDLQVIVDAIHERGRYRARLPYADAPDPPLDGLDATWADALLRERGLRP